MLGVGWAWGWVRAKKLRHVSFSISNISHFRSPTLYTLHTHLCPVYVPRKVQYSKATKQRGVMDGKLYESQEKCCDNEESMSY